MCFYMCDCENYEPPPFDGYNELFNSYYTTVESLYDILQQYEKSIEPCPNAYVYNPPIVQRNVSPDLKNKVDTIGYSYQDFLNTNACLIQQCIRTDNFEELRDKIPPGMTLSIKTATGEILFQSNF